MKSLGPQGELLFIEALSKDSNPLIRLSGAKGLAKIGVSTIRTLLCGLYDENPNVRKVVENQIMKNYTYDNILIEFYDKQPQLLSLKLTIRDIMEKKIPLTVFMQKYLIEFLNVIEFHEYEKLKAKDINSKITTNYNNKNDEIIIKSPTPEIQYNNSQNAEDYKKYDLNDNNYNDFSCDTFGKTDNYNTPYSNTEGNKFGSNSGSNFNNSYKIFLENNSRIKSDQRLYSGLSQN